MASWTTPVTHVTGDVVVASDWNGLANDLTFLSGQPGATVAAAETTTSASYVDLTTAGPVVTITTGANAMVFVTGGLSNSSASVAIFMGFTVSGASTVAADDTRAVRNDSPVATGVIQATAAIPVGLTAGSNIFTAKYRTTGGTATFQNRRLWVFPLP